MTQHLWPQCSKYTSSPSNSFDMLVILVFQGDAKRAAIDEEGRLKEETRERQQELKERQTKAALRQKHAQEKERMERAKSDLLEELDQMEQADRRRRQLIVSNIPVSLVVLREMKFIISYETIV